MKKNFKRIISITVSVLIFISTLAITASAANATIAFSSSKPQVGQSFTVTVTISPGQKMYSTEFNVNYTPEVFEFVSADCDTGAAGGGTVKAAPPENSNKTSHKFTFKAISSGAGTFAVDGVAYAENDDIKFGASAGVTVSDAAKSDNANLKSLSVSAGKLSPGFSSATTSYSLTVPNKTDKCNVYATAEDGGAKVDVDGPSTLSIGKNTFTVTVTAPSGKQKTYKITVTRQEESSSSESSESSSSEESSSQTESQTEENPYSAKIDDKDYVIAEKLTDIKLFEGFSETTVKRMDADVAVAQDGKKEYTLYYLKPADGEAYAPYTMDENGNFKKLKYATYGNNTYIFADFPKNSKATDGYYATSLEIQGNDIRGYAPTNEKLNGFYYVYCFRKDKYNVYRYDSREDVLQRSPDFDLTVAKAEKTVENKNFASRFASLSFNSKMTLICLLLAVAAFIALIVLIIVKFFKKEAVGEFDGEETVTFGGDFDKINIMDGSKPEFTDEQEQTEENK